MAHDVQPQVEAGDVLQHGQGQHDQICRRATHLVTALDAPCAWPQDRLHHNAFHSVQRSKSRRQPRHLLWMLVNEVALLPTAGVKRASA